MSRELKYLADQRVYEYKQLRDLLVQQTDYQDKTYLDWLFENKVPPGMLEIYSQYMFGAVMGQTFPALFIFEWLLNFYPIEYIVEIGTGTGGLTMFLQFQANIRRLGFATYDARNRFKDKKHQWPANQAKDIESFVNFRCMDVFSKEAIEEISSIMKKHVVLLYCDDGDKPREIKTYVPFALKGSILGTHDWHGHFGIEEMEKELGLRVLYEDICQEGLTKMRWWIKEK